MRLLTSLVRQLCRSRPSLHQVTCSRCLYSTRLSGSVDRYNGITVDIPEHVSPVTTVTDFQNILKDSVSAWREEGRIAVWLKFPVGYSRYIDAAAGEGFTYHHAENDTCMMKLWLGSREDSLPRFATHQLGVCGVVFREDTNELLVMQEKKSQYNMFWKFPGGLADLGENFGDAAVRETFEETGIRTKFASVLAMRQQHDHPMAFGRSDMYVVCRLLPLTFDLDPCGHEVLQCRWMPLTDVLENVQITSITHRIVSLMRHGLTHGFDNVDITFEEMESVYKGLRFHLYHRPLPGVAR